MKRIWKKYIGPAIGLVVAGSMSVGTSAAQTPKYFDPELRLSAPQLTGLPRLRFLTSLDFPPFNFADATKKPTGINVDLSRAICEELEIQAKCEIQAMPWADLEEALQAGRGEAIIAGTAITAEKRQLFNLSNTYFKFPARFIAKSDFKLLEGETLNDKITGKTVAAVRGSAHAQMLKTYFQNLDIKEQDDIQALYKLIGEGGVDLAFVDGVSSSFWLTSPSANNCCRFVGEAYYSDQFLGLGMAVVTRKSDVTLSQAINAALKAIEDNGKYLEIYQRYFPNSPHGSSF